MKKVLVTLAAMSFLILPALSFAAVTGSDHDMRADDVAPGDLCMSCHMPHNATGTRTQFLWARPIGGTFPGVMGLCYTCHDGVIAPGNNTVFNTTLEQHSVGTTDCSGAGACHDVHTQNPNLTGKFAVVTQTNGSYCETCHDATMFPGAESYGDHTAGTQHFTDGTFTCNQCHTVHGATIQTNNPIGIDDPVLLADNRPGAYYGAFCISCHNGTAPTPALPGTGGQAATDVWNYAVSTNDGTESAHPTISTTGFTPPMDGCDNCHDVHNHTLTPEVNYVLQASNANSAYCVSCHNGTSGPAVGANTHYTGVPADPTMNPDVAPLLPWANQIDEDGVVGADWTGATANNMVCESCHSVHKQGFAGVGQEYLLRRANGSGNAICSACHTAN